MTNLQGAVPAGVRLRSIRWEVMGMDDWGVADVLLVLAGGVIAFLVLELLAG